MKTAGLLLYLLLTSTFAFTQTVIHGVVQEKDNEPIIAANIGIAGSFDGTSSDVDGHFSFSTTETGAITLLVSSLGFESQEVPVELLGDTLDLIINLKATISELDAVVITAGAFEASDRNKAVVMRPLDIVTTAGATADIAGALNTLPGTQRNAEEGQLFVRGGAAYETRTYIDGLRVQQPYGSTIPNIPARGRFSPFLFKGTVFSTGGYSAEYGQALSSALILETGDLAEETVTGISLLTVGGGLAHTQRWENSSLAVNGFYTNLGPYQALINQNIEWDNPISSENLQAIYRHKTSETGILKLFVNATHSDMGMQYPDPAAPSGVVGLNLDNRLLDFNGSYREILGEKWSLFTGMAFAAHQEQINIDFAVDRQDISAQNKTTLIYHPLENLGFKFGTEYLYTRFDESYLAPDGGNFETTLEDHQPAAFVEAEFSLQRKLAARVGLRSEHTTVLNAWNLAPRVSLAYKTGEKSQISLAYGEFFQNPENEWLRYGSELDFERSRHFMLNYQLINEDYIFRVEGYYKKYQDLVRFPEAQPWFSDNSGQGYATGIDLYFRDKKTIKNGDYWISYSFLQTEREYLDFPEAIAPRYASPHNLSVVYKHWFPKMTTFMGLTYAYSSPRRYDDPNTPGFGDSFTPDYHDLSFNASYLTQLFGQFTILYVSATNILGFDQSFGERFSETPNANGEYGSITIQPPAKHFFLVGLFISIGQDPEPVN